MSDLEKLKKCAEKARKDLNRVGTVEIYGRLAKNFEKLPDDVLLQVLDVLEPDEREILCKNSEKIQKLCKKDVSHEAKTNWADLSLDIKKKMIFEHFEPSEILPLVTKKIVPTEKKWKELLDKHYDFVTQGFSVGKTNKEKFRYLAKRVSANTDFTKTPKFVFVHNDGLPLGTDSYSYRLSQINKDFVEELGEELEDMKEDLAQDNKSILSALEASPSIGKIQRDKYNAWTELLDQKKLSREYQWPALGGHARLIRDREIYDLPSERKTSLAEENISYPGKVNKTIKAFGKVMNILEDEDIPEDEHFSDLFEFFEMGATDMLSSPQYITYKSMSGFELQRSSAETLTDIIYPFIGGKNDLTIETYRKTLKK